MEKIFIDKDIEVLCITANSFPEGILEAHQKLHSIIPFSKDRRYFGISRPEKGVIVYKAAAEKLENDAEANSSCETFVIAKGTYRCINVLEYHKNIQSIGNAFEELTSDTDIDPNGYCIEWYYNDKDVKCMIRIGG